MERATQITRVGLSGIVEASHARETSYWTREAPAGEACIVPPDRRLCIGQRMVLLRIKQTIVSGEWVVHSIYSGHVQRFITDLSNATTVAHLNMSDIPDIPIAVPDFKETTNNS